MDDAVARIAEQKIREAQEQGEFEHLPGEGKPLDLLDLSLVPEELRVAFLALRNAGYLSEEAQLRKEVAQLEASLAASRDEAERLDLTRQLRDKSLRLAYISERWTKKPRFSKPRRRR
ncbi:MAG: DUF1992 domain-containing protein [Chloroflexi bacterium]|nr:DUF1992 domain-containing protein [Chloroflexota bacterium]